MEVKGKRRKKIRRKETEEEEEEESQTEAQPVTSNPQGTDCSSGVEECRTTRSLCLTFFNNHTTVISSSRKFIQDKPETPQFSLWALWKFRQSVILSFMGILISQIPLFCYVLMILSYCITLYRDVSYRIVMWRIISRHLVLCRIICIVSCHIVSYRIVSCCIVLSFDVTYHIAPYRVRS